MIEDRSYVAYLKRQVHREVTAAKFEQRQIAEIDIIVSEITSNLIKHVGGGEVLFRINEHSGQNCFEVLGIDNGPGMLDSVKMTKDGVSTTNTLGHGLGAINKLSNFFQLYSIKG